MRKIKLETAEDAKLINAFKDNKDSLINSIYGLIEKAALNNDREIKYSFKKYETNYYAQIKPLMNYFENRGFYVGCEFINHIHIIRISW